jgi:hypothetical protein
LVLPFPLADVPDELLDLTDAVEQMQVSALLHRQTDGVHHPVDVTGTSSSSTRTRPISSALEGTGDGTTGRQNGQLRRPCRRWPLVPTGVDRALRRGDVRPGRVRSRSAGRAGLLSGLPVVPYASLGGNLALAVDHAK